MQAYKIITNRKIALDTFEISFENKEKQLIQAGQFAMLYLQDEQKILGRPFSFSNIKQDQFSIIYKVVGAGTLELSKMRKGESLFMRLPLGKGFKIDEKAKSVLIYAGGLGYAPLMSLIDQLESQKLTLILGFQTKDAVYGLENTENINMELYTDDGSFGLKGTIGNSEINPYDYDCVYACGPQAMLAGLLDRLQSHPQAYLSLEERMACGYGVCMGCVCGKENQHRVCVEGPVFNVKELI